MTLSTFSMFVGLQMANMKKRADGSRASAENCEATPYDRPSF